MKLECFYIVVGCSRIVLHCSTILQNNIKILAIETEKSIFWLVSPQVFQVVVQFSNVQLSILL